LVPWKKMLWKTSVKLKWNFLHFLYRLSGLCNLKRVIWTGTTLFNFFMRRLTNVHKWIEEINNLDLCSLRVLSLSQDDWRQSEADIRWAGFKRRTWLIRSLASFETVRKCSEGKLKSHRKILLVVSSSESSRKGERPL